MQISKELLDKHGRRFDPGETIFKENDPADEMYVILKGEVEILKRVRQAQRMLGELKEGDIFGEMALVDKKPRSAMARAKTDVLVCAIDNHALDRLIRENAGFAGKVIRMLTHRLREADSVIADLLSKDRMNLVVGALVRFAKSQGMKSYKGSSVSEKNFTAWAHDTIGIEKTEVRTIILQLIDAGMLDRAQTDPDFIILTERLARRSLPREARIGY